jgi:hypothetical protein
MANKRTGSPIYKVIGFALAGLVVAQAIIFLVILRPSFERKAPTAKVAELLAARFPGAEAEVTGPAGGLLRVSLTVPFDPTVDAEKAHETFGRVAAAAAGPRVAGADTLEVTLRGVSLEGGPTSATRTFDYGPNQSAAE